MPETIFLSTTELAKRWGMSVQTIRSWRAEGRGPEYVKLYSGHVRYRIDVIEAYEKEMIVIPQKKGGE